MNWMRLATTILGLAPYVVAGVEKLHAEASGATKRQLAQDALSLAVSTAAACAPGQQQAVQGIGDAVGQVIDATVALANASGDFTHKQPLAPDPAQ
jgi:hypothetical protein